MNTWERHDCIVSSGASQTDFSPNRSPMTDTFILLRMPDSQEVTKIGDISDYRLSEQPILTLNRSKLLASENMDLINIKS